MIKQEIGSEFHLKSSLYNVNVPRENTVFSYLKEYNVAFFDSGRSALRDLLGTVASTKVLLPDYICESVRYCFPHSVVDYYRVDEKFHIDWNDLLEKCKDNIDILYLHYFNGYIGENYDFEELSILRATKGFIIIEDTTHSFLSRRQTIGDYCICSLRKWFPIPDGGVLYTKNELKIIPYKVNSWSLEKKNAMIEKGLYLEGEDIDKRHFLSVFGRTENVLDNQGKPFALSLDAYYALKHININEVAQIRCRNYDTLAENLKEIESYEVAFGGKTQVPLFFMISIEQRDLLRKYLGNKNIYCPVHWALYEELENRKESVWNSSKELSIPIDQRYSMEDMLYIADVLNGYFETNVRGKEI